MAKITEWRWIDEQGRAMTRWKATAPPPMTEVSDERGTMKVETREVDPEQYDAQS